MAGYLDMLLYECHFLGVHCLLHKLEIGEFLVYYELKSRIFNLYRLGMTRMTFSFLFKEEEYKQIISEGPVRSNGAII